MNKNSKFFKSLIAILVAMLMVGTLIPTAAAAGVNDVAVVAENTQSTNPLADLIQTIKNIFQSFLDFIRNLFAGVPKPVDPDVSAAKINEILNAENGAVIDGEGVTVSIESPLNLSKNITIKNITFESKSKSAVAVAINPSASVTLDKVTVIGKLWVGGSNVVLKNCTFDTNMNIDGVDGLLIENCTFTATNPITFGSTVANVTIKNNTIIVPGAQIRIHENITSISKVVIVNNELPFMVLPDVGATAVYAQAVTSGNFVFIK